MATKEYSVKLQHNVFVPMRDGVRLATDIYRPDARGKFPALLSMSPYGKERQAYPGGFYMQVEAGDIENYVRNGYVHVIADCRGSMPSQGQWNFTDKDEQLDGYDLIEWMAKQPWCDGNVAMVGESYFAVIQYLVAATQPPHLKTIVPFDGWTDFYRDVAYHGGIYNVGFMAYLNTIIYERLQQEVLYGEIKKPVQGWVPPGNIILDTTTNSTDGPYYWERSARTRFEKIKVPAYHMPCSHHYVHCRGQLQGWRDIDTPKKLFVGGGSPWALSYGAGASKQIVRWLDHWLKGIDTKIMSEPPVTIYLGGSGDWRYEFEYPLARTKWTPLYLRGGDAGPVQGPIAGQLSRNAPGNETPNTYKNPEAMRLTERNLPALSYSTGPLKEDLELVGPASLVLYAAIGEDDASWMVKIDDVAPDGSFQVITQGWLKASHRAVDKALSATAQPWHPHTRPQPVVPGDIEEYQIEIWPIFRTFKKDHELRVRIANSDSRNWDVRPHHAAFERPYAVTVHHSQDYPSHLLLPVIPPGKPPTNVKPGINFQPREGTVWPKAGL